MAYTTEGDVEKYLAVDIDNSNMSTQLTSWIAAVKAWIDKYCGKSFEAASETRYYDCDGKNRIIIDSFVGDPTEVSILDIDGSTVETLAIGQGEGYITAPYNYTEKNEIILQNRRLPRGHRRLKVTASFGASSSVPSDIKLAATKLVASIVEKGFKGGKLSQVTLGDYNASFSEIDEHADMLGVFHILDHYRDIDL